MPSIECTSLTCSTPGQEAAWGTWDCRFGGESFLDLGGNDHPARHARICAKADFLATANLTLDTDMPMLEQCTWLAPSGHQCKRKDFKNSTEVAQHLDGHVSRAKSGNRCRLTPCNEQINGIDFESKVSWYGHLLSVHKIAMQWVKTPARKTETGTADPYIHWCGLCGTWLYQLEEDLDQHAAGHEELIGQIIWAEGYSGVQMAEKMIRPVLNPFAVRNASLEFWARFKSNSDPGGFMDTMARHVRDLDQDGQFQCPASLDAGGYIKATCDDQSEMEKTDPDLSPGTQARLKTRFDPKAEVQTRDGSDLTGRQ